MTVDSTAPPKTGLCGDCQHPPTVHFVGCGVEMCNCSSPEFNRSPLRDAATDLLAALKEYMRTAAGPSKMASESEQEYADARREYQRALTGCYDAIAKAEGR